MQQSKTFLLCPFDKTHIIDPDKFKKHLEKCKSPYRKDFVQCQYDPLHWVLLPEIMKHQKNCLNSIKKVQISESKQSRVQLSSIKHEHNSSSDDDIKEINMGFAGQKMIRKDLFSKDLKKIELENIGTNGRWRQPNFSEWYKKLQGIEKRDFNHGKKSELNILNFEDSF